MYFCLSAPGAKRRVQLIIAIEMPLFVVLHTLAPNFLAPCTQPCHWITRIHAGAKVRVICNFAATTMPPQQQHMSFRMTWCHSEQCMCHCGCTAAISRARYRSRVCVSDSRRVLGVTRPVPVPDTAKRGTRHLKTTPTPQKLVQVMAQGRA